ncbi:MAG: hypothetical protein IIV74_03805 [Alphaproteobacteria bacterium]|nr:hypothetical protein [Alphaproteobacteria bacterium]
MSKKNTIKVIGIIDDNHITGIRYGLVEIDVPETKITTPTDTTKKINPTGPIRQTHTHIKQPALKWRNKISAAKKRILDAQKQKIR